MIARQITDLQGALLRLAKDKTEQLLPRRHTQRLARRQIWCRHQTAPNAEMAEHLGYDKHDPSGRGSGNSRNGSPPSPADGTKYEFEDCGSFCARDVALRSPAHVATPCGRARQHSCWCRGTGDHPALENAWSEFVPFLVYDVEIRRVICSTSAVESINARYRRAIRTRGHFPTGQAALQCLSLVTRLLDPTGRGKARWAMRWPALNAFAITFNGRITPTGD